jgi:membrane protease YdiL (CAAX protease family)
MSEPVKSISIESPSLKLSILIIFIYLFAIFPLVSATVYVLILIGYPLKIIKSNLSVSILIAQICLTITITCYLIKKYSNYLFQDDWRVNFVDYLYVGLKWSIPLGVIYVIALSIPSSREKLIEYYLSMKILMVKDISNFRLLIFSIWVLSGAICEEIIFRGIILQKLQENLHKNLSVFIIAVLFALSHCIFFHIEIAKLTYAFIVGLVCGFAFTATRSCVSAIVPHLLNNVVCIIFVSIIR